MDPDFGHSDFDAPSEWYQVLFIIRKILDLWAEDWGPASLWPSTIPHKWRTAKSTGLENEWTTEMRGRAECARAYLAELRRLSCVVIPRNRIEARDVWNQAFEFGLTLSLVVLNSDIQDHSYYAGSPPTT